MGGSGTGKQFSAGTESVVACRKLPGSSPPAGAWLAWITSAGKGAVQTALTQRRLAAATQGPGLTFPLFLYFRPRGIFQFRIPSRTDLVPCQSVVSHGNLGCS